MAVTITLELDDQTGKGFAQMRDNVKDTEQATDGLNDETRQYVREMEEAKEATTRLEREVKDATGQLGRMADEAEKTNRVLKGFAVAGGAMAAFGALKGAIDQVNQGLTLLAENGNEAALETQKAAGNVKDSLVAIANTGPAEAALKGIAGGLSGVAKGLQASADLTNAVFDAGGKYLGLIQETTREEKMRQRIEAAGAKERQKIQAAELEMEKKLLEAKRLRSRDFVRIERLEEDTLKQIRQEEELRRAQQLDNIGSVNEALFLTQERMKKMAGQKDAAAEFERLAEIARTLVRRERELVEASKERLALNQAAEAERKLKAEAEEHRKFQALLDNLDRKAHQQKLQRQAEAIRAKEAAMRAEVELEQRKRDEIARLIAGGGGNRNLIKDFQQGLSQQDITKQIAQQREEEAKRDFIKENQLKINQARATPGRDDDRELRRQLDRELLDARRSAHLDARRGRIGQEEQLQAISQLTEQMVKSQEVQQALGKQNAEALLQAAKTEAEKNQALLDTMQILQQVQEELKRQGDLMKGAKDEQQRRRRAQLARQNR